MHDLLAIVLPAKDAIFITPNGRPLLLERAGDREHALGIGPRVANEDLRLAPFPISEVCRTMLLPSFNDARERNVGPGWISTSHIGVPCERLEDAL